MKSKRFLVPVVIVVAVVLAGGQMFVNNRNHSRAGKLAVVWTSGDPEVAHKVCFMYTHNAKRAKWFDEVVLIVWGPSSRILAGDRKLQAAVKQMMNDGVVVKACVVCADMYGVAGRLREMGIEVIGYGQAFVGYAKGRLQGDYVLIRNQNQT